MVFGHIPTPSSCHSEERSDEESAFDLLSYTKIFSHLARNEGYLDFKVLPRIELNLMKIKICASIKVDAPTPGPYKTIDIIERKSPYQLGDMTHYGEVVLLLPDILWLNDDVQQGVVVNLDPLRLDVWCEESVMEKPPTSYNKIQFFPINAAWATWDLETPLAGPYKILPLENLTIENMSRLITPSTFSLWKSECNISKQTAESLESVKFAIVHRHTSPNAEDGGLETHSTFLIDCAASCLALIRPTRRSRALHIRGVIKPDGSFDPQGFSAREDLADVPEIQKLFMVREQDVQLLTSILPEFIQVYQKDENGKLTNDYEPLRMAVQLYGEGYALSYWKARHILWWSAIEALYGNSEDAAMARIYSFLGDKRLVDGYRKPIYEKGDIPSCFYPSTDSLHTLGKMVPLIYEVRNSSAHGQKVSDSHFVPVPHPFGQGIGGLDALAEAATFIIRTTIVEILKRGFRDNFKDRDTREHFWLYQHGLDKNQSKKRLKELKELLKIEL